MDSDVEIESAEATWFEITEDGSIVIEKSKDGFIVECSEGAIDLTKPFRTEGFTLIQNDVTIPFQNEHIYKYFLEVLAKEKPDGNN